VNFRPRTRTGWRDDLPKVDPSAPTHCAGKRIYPTYRLADRAARKLRRIVDGSHAKPFRCRVCRAWHVGEDLSQRTQE
jgi:hypothetical protein